MLHQFERKMSQKQILPTQGKRDSEYARERILVTQGSSYVDLWRTAARYLWGQFRTPGLYAEYYW